VARRQHLERVIEIRGGRIAADQLSHVW
jgi:hypothetical protein